MAETYIVGSAVLALLVFFAHRLAYRKLPLPPGPPAKFISGNVHQVPKSEPWRTYAKWLETYGG
jgi:hypothetical protein